MISNGLLGQLVCSDGELSNLKIGFGGGVAKRALWKPAKFKNGLRLGVNLLGGKALRIGH